MAETLQDSVAQYLRLARETVTEPKGFLVACALASTLNFGPEGNMRLRRGLTKLGEDIKIRLSGDLEASIGLLSLAAARLRKVA